MKRVRSLGTVLIAITLLTPIVFADSHDTKAPVNSFDALLQEAKESAEARLLLRIEIEGQLDDGLRRLAIFGRGIGIWDGKRQFVLSDDAVAQTLNRLLESGFSAMPDRFPPREPDDRQNPVQMIRMITVHVGGQMKMVIQDSKGAKSDEFKRLVDDLVALCAEPARKGRSALNLEDGLRKVADGTLAGETLWINANAPQMRSLESQRGQGWLVAVRAGLLTVQTHDIHSGYRKRGERPLDADEAQRIAKELIAAGVHELAANVCAEGHTQLTVAVLDQKVRTLARANSGCAGEAGEGEAKNFEQVRRFLQNLYEVNLKIAEHSSDQSSTMPTKRSTDG
jgi:hypothetical protein